MSTIYSGAISPYPGETQDQYNQARADAGDSSIQAGDEDYDPGVNAPLQNGLTQAAGQAQIASLQQANIDEGTYGGVSGIATATGQTVASAASSVGSAISSAASSIAGSGFAAALGPIMYGVLGAAGAYLVILLLFGNQIEAVAAGLVTGYLAYEFL